MICPNCENEYDDALGADCPYCVDVDQKCAFCHKRLSDDSTKRYLSAICILKIKKGTLLKDIKRENLTNIFDIISMIQLGKEVYCCQDCADNDMKMIFGKTKNEEGIKA